MKYKVLEGHHVGLTVKSLVVSKFFYTELLGLDEVFSWSPEANYIKEVTGYKDASFLVSVLKVPGIEYYLELIEYQNTDQVEIDHRNGNPGIAHIAFRVEDVDSFHEHLLGHGIQSVSAPVTPETGPNEGGRIVYMIDPDGYRIELIQTNKVFGNYQPKSDS